MNVALAGLNLSVLAVDLALWRPIAALARAAASGAAAVLALPQRLIARG